MQLHPTGCACCQSFNDGTIWICGGDQEQSDWIPTTKKWRTGWRGKVYVGCCNRNEFPRNTEAQFYSAYDGYVAGWRFRCASEKGCNKNPGYKRTAHLRYYEED